jgi:hypothetical protein
MASRTPGPCCWARRRRFAACHTEAEGVVEAGHGGFEIDHRQDGANEEFQSALSLVGITGWMLRRWRSASSGPKQQAPAKTVFRIDSPER